MKEDKDNRVELEKKYEVLKKKFKLPDFDLIDEDFGIEKIPYENNFLLREIRRVVSDKVSHYNKFIEMMLSPVNVPLFVYSFAKSLRADDKIKLGELYNTLSKDSFSVVKLDLVYNEENEAEYISDVYGKWQKIKKVLYDIIENVEKNSDKSFEGSNKDYYG